MPQLQPVPLVDRDNTSLVFVPLSIENNVATLVHPGSSPLADKRMTISSVRTKTGRHKITIRFVSPVVQDNVINGVAAPSVVRTHYADITFTFDNTSTEAERNNFIGMIQYSFNKGIELVDDTVTLLQGVY